MMRQSVERLLTAQAELPPGLVAVPLSELSPRMRGLLLTDGTVTRTIEAWTLRPVEVQVLEQHHVTCPSRWRRRMDLPDDRGDVTTLRRRVAIHAGAPRAAAVHAESMIVPERLPRAFLRSLLDARQGIGEVLSDGRQETCRELLWLGAGPVPAWAPTPSGERWAVVRGSRIIIAGTTAILLTEWFAADRYSGELRLGGRPA